MLEDLRGIATAYGLTVSAPYRVGFGSDLLAFRMCASVGDWPGVRYRVKTMVRGARRRSWWGLWQCEGALGLDARRGLTARAAERRMLVDEIAEGYRRWSAL